MREGFSFKEKRASLQYTTYKYLKVLSLFEFGWIYNNYTILYNYKTKSGYECSCRWTTANVYLTSRVFFFYANYCSRFIILYNIFLLAFTKYRHSVSSVRVLQIYNYPLQFLTVNSKIFFDLYGTTNDSAGRVANANHVNNRLVLNWL